MARIRLWSHAASDTLNRLKDSLTSAGHNVKKLRREGGTYRGRVGDLVLNYGSSNLPSEILGQATVLNAPANITNASNKRSAFARMEQGNVRTVEYTTQRSVAEAWLREGALVYVRHQLQGHSGEGIDLAYNNPAALGDAGQLRVTSEVPNAPLYTKGILGNRREYRVHVFKGMIIHVAQKRRRDGFAEIEERNNLVRNHHTGWVYSTQNMTALNHAGKCEALKAVAVLNLDFGAVDIITNRDDAWVLEVNTAPGMEGVTLEKYTAAINSVAIGEVVQGMTVEGYADFRQTQPQAQPNANTTSGRTNAPAAPAQRERVSVRETEEAVAAARPAATQQAAPASRQTGRQSTALVDGGYYWLTFNGEQTIGKFGQSVNSFEIIGWEVPVERADATVGARIVQ